MTSKNFCENVILNIEQELHVYVILCDINEQYFSSMMHFSHSIKNLDFEMCLQYMVYQA